MPDGKTNRRTDENAISIPERLLRDVRYKRHFYIAALVTKRMYFKANITGNILHGLQIALQVLNSMARLFPSI